MAISQINSNSLASGVPASSNMPTGSVLQVVQTVFSSQSSTTGTTFVNTGMSVSITPKFSTSKVLLLSNLGGIYSGSSNTYSLQRIQRNGSTIVTFDGISGYSSTGSSTGGACSITYLDSPATTSAISYVLQISSSGSGQISWANSSLNSTLTAMEIAA
jgi:hypothetical protein